MGKHDQLNLRIVRGKEDATFFRDKRGTDPPPLLGAHGNVLQIGVLAGKSARFRSGLGKRRMDPSGFLVDLQRKLVDIGILQFAQHPVMQDQGNFLIGFGQGFQHIG